MTKARTDERQNTLVAIFRVMLATGVTLLAACNSGEFQHTTSPDSRSIVLQMSDVAQSRAAQSQIDSAEHGRQSRGVQDDMLRIESAAPGFAGYYIDDAGALVARLTKPENEGRARAAISRLMTKREHGKFNSVGHVKTVRMSPAVYTLSQLVAWQEALFPVLVKTPEFQLIGANVKLNRLAIGLTDKAAEHTVLDIIRQVGIPLEAVTIEIEGQHVPLSGLRGTWRPTFGGVQLMPDASGGEVGVCSLGFNVTTPNGDKYALTAAHCVVEWDYATGHLGDEWWQPGSLPQNKIGTVQMNPAWTSTDTRCVSTASLCTLADVAGIRYLDPAAFAKSVARTTCCIGPYNGEGSLTVVGQWPVTAIVSPSLAQGAYVEKLGRTTGWTKGQVDLACAHLVFQLGSVGPYTVICTTRVSGSWADRGDSGGPEYIDTMMNSRAAEGILFAIDRGEITGRCGNPCKSYYSPWPQIQAHFGQAVIPY